MRLRRRRLRFLHVASDPALRELDLRDCAPGLDLTLEPCPSLERILLPETGEGAVLHLDLGQAPAALELIGAIRSLDACWSGGDFDLATAGRPLRSGRIGARRRWFAPEHEVHVLHGVAVPAELSYDAAAHPRQLLILAAPRLAALRLPAAGSLEALQLKDCPRLETISGAHVRRLRAIGCPQLARLDIAGHAAVLGGSGGDTLRIEQPWSFLTLADSPTRCLRAPALGELTLRDCSALREARVAESAAVTLSGRTCVALEGLFRLRLDERAVGGLVHRAREGDEPARRTLEHWCAYASKPREYLETLRALAGAEGDVVWLWTLRSRLHARCNKSAAAGGQAEKCLRYAQTRWDWRFPADCYLEGWEADLSLWLRARTHLPELEALLRHQPPLAAVAALARRMHERPQPAMEAALCRAIERARMPRDEREQPQPGLVPLAFEQLAGAAVALRSPALADALVARLAGEPGGWLGLSALGTLGAFGHADARAALMGYAHHRDPAVREQALSLALSPMRSTALTREEVAHD